MAEPILRPIISQDELQEFCALRIRYKTLKDSIREKLGDDVEVQFGVHSAKLVETSTKRPNWKGFITKKHGKKVVARILAATKATHYLRMEIR